MNNHLIATTGLCLIVLLSNTYLSAEDRKISAAQTKKEVTTQKTQTLSTTDPLSGRSATFETATISATDILTDRSIALDATTVIIDSYVVMGECQEGLNARKEIEYKKELASQEIQDESRIFEKAKAEYISKSTTMSDTAQKKEEQKLLKMERDLKNLVAEKEEELKHDMQIATEMLAQSLEAGVARLAENEHIDIVFDKMTGRTIYVSDKFNFTDKAIKEVDKNYEIKLAQNKKTEESVKIADNRTSSNSIARTAKAGV